MNWQAVAAGMNDRAFHRACEIEAVGTDDHAIDAVVESLLFPLPKLGRAR
jgi:hypothetical protein